MNGGNEGSFNTQSCSSSLVRKRKVFSPSSIRNRKNKEMVKGGGVDEVHGRPSKRKQIGDAENLVDVSVVAAVQPHRSQ